jgi:outer membrane protein OmpA-like peptidoglycan-associated protein
MIRKNPGTVWEIGAHTDCRASKDYNLRLSEGRAHAIYDYMVAKGADTTRLTYHGYGETKLLNNCGCEPNDQGPGANCTEAEHAVNRRYELTLVKILDSNEK